MPARPSRDAAPAAGRENRAKSQPPGGKRRNAADVELLQQRIGNLMLMGVQKAGILAALATPELDDKKKVIREGIVMPPRTLDDYMRRVREAWEEEGKEESPTRRQRQLRRLQGHIRTMVARGKYDALANMERLVAQIEGNLAPVKIETGPPKRGWDSLSDDELEAFRTTGKLPAGVSAEDLDKPN